MSDPIASATGSPAAPRWPRVLGVLGIILAAVTLLDKAGDLLFLLLWTEEDWISTLGSELGPAVAPMIPPAPWIALTSLVWGGLATLLLVGSIRLRHCRRSGLAMCRLWSWLAISWFTIEMMVALWWLNRIGDQLAPFVPGGWEQYAGAGVLMAIVIMLSYPVFLLVWLSRPSVQRDIEGWSSTPA